MEYTRVYPSQVLMQPMTQVVCYHCRALQCSIGTKSQSLTTFSQTLNLRVHQICLDFHIFQLFLLFSQLVVRFLNLVICLGTLAQELNLAKIQTFRLIDPIKYILRVKGNLGLSLRVHADNCEKVFDCYGTIGADGLIVAKSLKEKLSNKPGKTSNDCN